MRKLLTFSLLIFVFAFQSDNKEIYIEIHDNQYGCYVSREYYLQDSTLTVDDYNEEGELHDSKYQNKDLLSRKLSAIQIQKEKEFMSHFPWDSLKADYNSGRDGCDSIRQMAITIRYNGMTKVVGIQDCYSEKVARIFKFINSLVPKNKSDLRIRYDAKTFKCRK